jgi:SAM-dependent methyltransferase
MKFKLLSCQRRLLNEALHDLRLKIFDHQLVLNIGSNRVSKGYDFQPNKMISLDVKDGLGIDVIGSLSDIPLEQNKFDFVFCIEVMQYVTEPVRGLREIQRVLKKGGIGIVSFPSLTPPHRDPSDIYRFNEGVMQLFKEVDIEPLYKYSLGGRRGVYSTHMFFMGGGVLGKFFRFFSLLLALGEKNHKEILSETSGYLIVWRKK